MATTIPGPGWRMRACRAAAAWLGMAGSTAAAVAAQDATLAAAVQSIRLDAGNGTFDDLEPLVGAIGNARVVVLGEATHSDGAVTGAKARVVRFLTERMGFDVLAWESGLVQVEAMNQDLRNPNVPLDQAASHLMSGGWATQEEVQPLLVYARDSWLGPRPLLMAGLDEGRPRKAASDFAAVLDPILERAPWLLSSEEQRPRIDSLASRAFGFLSPEQAPAELRSRQREAAQRLLSTARASHGRLRTIASPREISLFEAALRHVLDSEYQSEARGLERAYSRDASMAENLRWLLAERHPDRKIIVWAATAHFIRNSTLIANADDSTMYRLAFEAGNHLAPWLGDDMYTLAFTTYGGEQGDEFPPTSDFPSSVEVLEPAPASTLEGRLHALGHEAAFLDLRGAPDDRWWSGSFPALLLGRLYNTARWKDVVDGILFVDASRPVRYIR